MSKSTNPPADDGDDDSPDPVALYKEYEDVADELAERDDIIGAMARAHRRVATEDADAE